MNCTYVPSQVLNELKKYKNGLDLFYKHGKDISKIPISNKIDFFDVRNANDLTRSFAGDINFDENEAFFGKYLDYGIAKDKGTGEYGITIAGKNYALPLLTGNSNSGFGVYKLNDRVVLTDYAKEQLILNHKDQIPHLSSIVKDLFPLASIQQKINALEELIKKKQETEDIEGIKEEFQKEIEKKNETIKQLNSKYNNYNIPYSFFSNTLIESVSYYGLLENFTVEDITHEDLKDFIVLKEKATGKHLVLHAYAGYRYPNQNSQDRMGSAFMDKTALNEVSMLATTSDTISLKMYLAQSRLRTMGKEVIDVVSSSYFYSKDLDTPPRLILDAPAFHKQIKPVFEYFIKVSPYNSKVMELYSGHKLLEKRNILSNNLQSRLNAIKPYMSPEESDILQDYVNKNDLRSLKKHLLKMLTKKKRKIIDGEAKAELTAFYELVQAVQEEGVGENLKERNTDDVSLITAYMNDASTIDNHFIQSVMSIIKEKLFEAKKTLLPFSNKVHNLTKAIIEEQSSKKYTHKPSFFPKGHEFFQNLISKDGRYAGLYVYVNPNKSNGAWANSAENKAGWHNLTQAEKDFSDYFVSELKQSYEKVYGEKTYAENWEDGRLPLMKKNVSLQMASVLNQVKEGDKKSAYDNLKDVMERAFGANENFAQIISDTSSTGVPNYYMVGENKSDHEKLAHEIVLKHGGIETDLYKVLLATKTNLEKKAEFDEIEGYFQLVKHMATREVSTDGVTENKNTLKLLDGIYTSYFKQQRHKMVSGNRKYKNYTAIRNMLKDLGYADVDKMINMSMRFNTFLTMALNPLNDIKNVAQGFLRGLSRGVSGTLSQLYGEHAPFTAQDFIKHWTVSLQMMFDPNRRDLVAQLLKITNTFNADLTNFANPKFQETDKRFWLFRSGSLFILNYLGDYANRTAVTLSMIDKEIGLDAFSLDANGNLVYDKTKDKRYSTPEGKLVVDTLISQGNIYGIDDKMSNFYKKISNETYGSYDNETFRLINMFSLGRLVLQFRRFLPDYLYESFAKGKHVHNTGRYVVKNGQVIWESSYEEGVIRSVMSLFNPRVLREVLIESKTLDPDVVSRKRKNLAKFASDMAFFMAMYLMYGLMNGDFDDDDDKGKGKVWFLGNKSNTEKFKSLIYDSVQTINPNTYSSLIKTPFLISRKLSQTIEILNKITASAKYAITGNTERAKKKAYKALDDFGEVTPVWNSGKKIMEQTEDILWSDTEDE